MRRRKFLAINGVALGLGAAHGLSISDSKTVHAWQQKWQTQLAELEQHYGGRLGVSVLETGSGQAFGWRDSERFALCSTFKMLLAGWVLARVDQGYESLTRRVTYSQSDLVDYSPITAAHADRDGMTVAQLCAAAVGWSDNTAANVLLRQHGGPAGLTAFLRACGDQVSRLDRYEPDLNDVPAGEVRDTTTPWAMTQVTQKLVLDGVLTPDSRAHLQFWLRDSRTGARRLRAGAPGWDVGDKTGSRDKDGIANDVAVMWPQDKTSPLVVSCYTFGVDGDGAKRDALVAEVARIAVAARAELRAA